MKPILEIHAVVSPPMILEALRKHQERYVSTYEDVKKIYSEQIELYQKEYNEYTQKELAGKLTANDRKNKPQQPVLPADKRKEYTAYISLYNTTQAEQVYLGFQDFSRFFLDEWDFVKVHIRHLRMLADSSTYGTTVGGNTMALNALIDYDK